MAGSKLGLRLCHSLLWTDRKQMHLHGLPATGVREISFPAYTCPVSYEYVLRFFAVTRITSVSRDLSSVEGCRLVLLIIVAYTFGGHPSTPNFPTEIGFICACFHHFFLLSCHKPSCCSQCRNSV